MTRPSRFAGTIGRTLAESDAWFDEPPHPGADAPDVVVILLDDTGFAQFGCYGSDIDTPNIDALATNGVQFTNFHVTPLCSPTRASLLTGRSQHAVGMRSLANFRTGFPNQLGHITNHAATVAEVLRDAGYATFCLGKWHLAPMEHCSAAGPFDQWPLARGFRGARATRLSAAGCGTVSPGEHVRDIAAAAAERRDALQRPVGTPIRGYHAGSRAGPATHAVAQQRSDHLQSGGPGTHGGKRP